MAIVVTDAASAVVNFLKSETGAADIRAMVQGGADGILEAGDLKGTTITEQLAARRNAGTPSVVLCIDVQDAGDRPAPVDKRYQTVIVRIYDQEHGYRNIRAVRDQVIKDLEGYVSPLTSVDGQKRGFLELFYLERSGIRYDRIFGVDFEAVAFRGIVDIEEGD